MKFLLKTPNNLETIIGLKIDIGIRFLIKLSRSHSSQQSQAHCWLCLTFIINWNCVSYFDSNTRHNCNFMLWHALILWQKQTKVIYIQMKDYINVCPKKVERCPEIIFIFVYPRHIQKLCIRICETLRWTEIRTRKNNVKISVT